jgi:hypothetical protein
MQDVFLLAYKGRVKYTEALSILRSLVKINIDQYVHWRTFQWHWETLASLIDYLPQTNAKFQVSIEFNGVSTTFSSITLIFTIEFCYSTNSQWYNNVEFDYQYCSH